MYRMVLWIGWGYKDIIRYNYNYEIFKKYLGGTSWSADPSFEMLFYRWHICAPFSKFFIVYECFHTFLNVLHSFNKFEPVFAHYCMICYCYGTFTIDCTHFIMVTHVFYTCWMLAYIFARCAYCCAWLHTVTDRTSLMFMLSDIFLYCIG